MLKMVIWTTEGGMFGTEAKELEKKRTGPYTAKRGGERHKDHVTRHQNQMHGHPKTEAGRRNENVKSVMTNGEFKHN